MVTKTRVRKSRGSNKRFIGKPTGQIQERVQAVGPEHFGIVAVDCAKRRSKWMLCNFYGKVIIEPTKAEHTAGGLRAMTQFVAKACKAEGLTDTIVAVEMTGIYHKPVYRAFRKAGFDTRIVHPFASSHYRQPLHPDEKTDDKDLEAIFHAAVKGYGLAKLPVGEVYQSLQAVSRHRHNLVKQRARLMVQIRRLLHQTMVTTNANTTADRNVCIKICFHRYFTDGLAIRPTCSFLHDDSLILEARSRRTSLSILPEYPIGSASTKSTLVGHWNVAKCCLLQRMTSASVRSHSG